MAEGSYVSTITLDDFKSSLDGTTGKEVVHPAHVPLTSRPGYPLM